MSRTQIFLGIVLFAMATAILYVWGLKKAYTQREDLQRHLLGKCARRVMRYLKTHENITKAEMARLIECQSVGVFWSKQRVRIENSTEFTVQLIAFLLDQQYIKISKQGYCLK